MSSSIGQGYEGYTPPKEEKRHPLTRHDTRELYNTAVDYPDREAELIVRTILDYGLRLGELVHCRSHWIDKEYNRELGEKIWRIKVPKVEYCWGGKGGKVGAANSDGANLHETDAACTNCVNRSWQGKIAPNGNKKRGWVTERQAEEYDYSPKKARSATKVWQFPSIPDAAETAQLLKDFVKCHPHQQWPHQQQSARNRLDKVVESADLNLPDRSTPKVVPHGLRHTYGCRLVEMGIGEGAAMKQMRHQNADVFRWYSDVRGTRVVSALADAVSETDSLLHE